MNGYIKKQALMDYCSNQVPRVIDLNDIARFPVAEVFTKDEVITLLINIRTKINNMYLDIDSMECVTDVIEEEINVLKGEEEDGKSSH